MRRGKNRMNQKQFDEAVEKLTDLAEDLQEETEATDEEIKDILDLVRQNWVR